MRKSFAWQEQDYTTIKHTFVYENHFDDRIMRNIDLMRAHAVGAAISWSIITVAELFRWDVIDLRDRRRRREREWDLVHERNHVVASRRNYGHNRDNTFLLEFFSKCIIMSDNINFWINEFHGKFRAKFSLKKYRLQAKNKKICDWKMRR